MTAPWPSPAPSRTTASTSVFLTTFVLIVASIVAFLAFDLWLAAIDSRESALHAAHLFGDGEAFLAAGKTHEAVDRFASAQALARGNVRYGVALAEALLADGRASEAETELAATLDRAESDGPANLAMARILTREGRNDQAVSYYHRAIYGSWPSDAPTRRLAARLELVDLLARRGAQTDMLAELLPLEDVDPDSTALRRRLAHLFVGAGSPERGIPIFRALLRRDPRDGDAYAGMGDAALALGNFRTAHADLLVAARLLGDSSRVAAKLMVADTALALDPSVRGIGAAARLERSRALLRRTLDATAECVRGSAESPLADSARTLLAPPAGAVRVPEDARADAMIDLASERWSARGADCRTGDDPAVQALALILAKHRG